MSRSQIAQLIAAVQHRARPSDRLPVPPEEHPVPADGRRGPVPEAEARSERTTPDWKRPQPPDWIPDESLTVPLETVPVGPEDEITIDAEDFPNGLDLYPPRSSPHSDAQAPPFDALAYYLPFHFYRTRWGIYLSETGILEVTRQVLGSHRLALTDRWVIGFAARALFLHEFFHHAVEVACSRLEFPGNYQVDVANLIGYFGFA